MEYAPIDFVNAQLWGQSDDPMAASEMARDLRPAYEALTRLGRWSGGFTEFLTDLPQDDIAILTKGSEDRDTAADPTGGS